MGRVGLDRQEWYEAEDGGVVRVLGQSRQRKQAGYDRDKRKM